MHNLGVGEKHLTLIAKFLKTCSTLVAPPVGLEANPPEWVEEIGLLVWLSSKHSTRGGGGLSGGI